MRLRVPAVLSLLSGFALAYIWFAGDSIRQVRVILTVVTLALTFAALLGWFVFGSGAPRKTRFRVAAGVTIALGIFGTVFRIRGVTGDLVPILEYRFSGPRALPEARSPRPGPPDSAAAASEAAAPGPDRPPATSSGTGVGAKASREPSPTPTAAAIASAPDHRDWPQFLGPNRSGVIPDAHLATDWTARPPRLLWRQPVGAGWAGFAVSSDIAVTQEQRGSEERVIAYELRTGRPLWSHADKAIHNSPLGGEGPRAVPAIDGGQVFAMGATGTLNALDLRTGRLLWSRNILKENNGAEPEWGVAVSPLVHGNRVIVSAGGSPGRALVAYDRNTGDPVWAQGSGGLGYSSPVLMRLSGRDQIVMLNKASVVGHDPESGVPLWEQEFPREQPNVAQPLWLSENRVLFSVGYGIGSKVFEISEGTDQALSARLVWSTPRLKSKFANMVAYQGSVYGLDDGVLVCLDPETGERRWKTGRFGHGQLILAGKNLLVQTEDGEVILIDPNPERLIEVTRFRALSGKTWNPPALAAPILLVRNDLEAAAYELPVVR